MSNQDFYNQQHPQQPAGHENLPSNNPYNSGGGGGGPPSYGNAPHQQQGEYAPPSGPPPGHHAATRRTDTFAETDFVPDNERGEQREAMEQFEMNKSGNESQQDRDVAQLQREFPGVDGSLIAAIHGDSADLGATREMLQELASQTQGGQGS